LSGGGCLAGSVMRFPWRREAKDQQKAGEDQAFPGIPFIKTMFVRLGYR